MAFCCHAPFFILLPRNPVIPGQLLLMRRGNEQRFSWGGGEERTEIIGSVEFGGDGDLLSGEIGWGCNKGKVWDGCGIRRFGIGEGAAWKKQRIWEP